MYTPLRAMQRCESLIKVEDFPEVSAEYNAKALEYFASIEGAAKDKLIRDAVIVKNRMKDPCIVNIRKSAKQHIKDIRDDFERNLRLHCGSLYEFSYQIMMANLYNTWMRAKRVYKFSEEMLHMLTHARLPKKISCDAMHKLPSDCFYFDYAGCKIFGDVCGTFVHHVQSENVHMYSFIHIVDHAEVFVLTDSIALVTTDEDDSECVTIRLENIPDNVQAPTQDSIPVYHKANDFMQFFVNFCLYMSTINRDVTYTERTRTTYRPPQDNSYSYKMREVEEFGVGFRYSNVKSSKTRVRTTKVGENDGPKRPYPSNWRSAHYQHFWVNDPDRPGEKKAVLKWIEETFVRGNITTTESPVSIHNVK